MNKSTLRNLAIVLFALVAILIGIEMSERGTDTSGGDLMLPGLKERINDVHSVTVEAPASEAMTISRASGTWSVSTRADYPAAVGTIRELLLGLADARILEQKTADPARYAALGVRDPEAPGSKGVRLTVTGDGFEYGLIVGDTNQGSNRYVRSLGEAASLLVDRALPLPDTVGGWLRTDLIDIDAADVRFARIRHADGETIEIVKSGAEDTEFQVQNIPAGRELSYPTVANGIGSALNDLNLDEVRRAAPGEPSTRAEFETFDGLRISVAVYAADGDSETDEPVWIALNVEAEPLDEPSADSVSAELTAGAAEEPAGDTAADPVARAATYQRLSGWQFQVADFKANQLSRRWDDILKDVAE